MKHTRLAWHESTTDRLGSCMACAVLVCQWSGEIVVGECTLLGAYVNNRTRTPANEPNEQATRQQVHAIVCRYSCASGNCRGRVHSAVCVHA